MILSFHLLAVLAAVNLAAAQILPDADTADDSINCNLYQ